MKLTFKVILKTYLCWNVLKVLDRLICKYILKPNHDKIVDWMSKMIEKFIYGEK